MVTEANLQKAIAQHQQQEEATFQWTKQWYPVAVVEFIDRTRPHAMQLLGKDVVLWRDGAGKWRCFADACPHRLAPLSEGRVESDGTLLCAYHAWRFDSEGKCVSIPQFKDKETDAKHCTNPRSCAIAYPTQELQGLLWVWAESGSQAEVESQQKTPRIIPELEENSDRAKQQKERWLDAVFTPNPQDKMVIAFRQWWEKRAGGAIPWATGCNAELDKFAEKI